ncbi:MAG: hypothetical protein R2849_06805 [Thermomicrobiales bacterium]
MNLRWNLRVEPGIVELFHDAHAQRVDSSRPDLALDLTGEIVGNGARHAGARNRPASREIAAVPDDVDVSIPRTFQVPGSAWMKPRSSVGMLSKRV